MITKQHARHGICFNRSVGAGHGGENLIRTGRGSEASVQGPEKLGPCPPAVRKERWVLRDIISGEEPKKEVKKGGGRGRERGRKRREGQSLHRPSVHQCKSKVLVRFTDLLCNTFDGNAVSGHELGGKPPSICLLYTSPSPRDS